jgi:non-ribosomal peptide synthetase component F
MCALSSTRAEPSRKPLIGAVDEARPRAKRLRGARRARRSDPPPEQHSVQRLGPATPMQQGMLFSSLADRRSDPYVQQMVGRTSRRIPDVAAFEATWTRIASRHDSFRTAFAAASDGTAGLAVRHTAKIAFAHLDWRDLPAAEHERRLSAFLEDDRRRGFDLDRAPLHRLAIIDGKAVTDVVWTSHHAVLDGRSRRIVLTELLSDLAAQADGREPPHAQATSFTAYAEWLARQDETAAGAFWTDRISGAVLPFETAITENGGTGPVRGADFAEVRLGCSAETTARFLGVTVSLGASPTVVLHAAWALLLSRHSDKDDVLFGAVRACRHGSFPGAERIVGPLLNTVPLRVRLESDELVRALITRLNREWREAAAHELAPLSATFKPTGFTPGRLPFESLLAFERTSLDEVARPFARQLGRWRFHLLAPTQFPLSITVTGGGRLALSLVYDRRRVRDGVATMVVARLAAAIAELCARLDDPVASVELLPAAERRLLTRTFACGGPRPARYASVCEQVETLRSSDAPALSDSRGSLTYAEMLARVDVAARGLRAIGVARGHVVGLWNEHSTGTIVALLAILRAGGAVVPLESTYPSAWREHVVADTTMSLIVGGQDAAAAAPAGARIATLAELLARGATARSVGTCPRPADLAYVLYTSGSTGRPKGVAMPHRSLANLVAWQRRDPACGGALRTLQLTPLAFDVGLQEVFATLAAGGELVVAPPSARRDAAALWSLLLSEKIERVFLTPALLDVLADAALAGWSDRARLRAVVAAGETLRVTPAVREMFARLSGCHLVNQYGPSETHVVTASTTPCTLENQYGPTETCQMAAHALQGDPREWPELPPIGRPIPGARVVLLDRSARLVPIGVPGEICIGGTPLARGYWHDPGGTAERFVTVATTMGLRRLYRTGDLGRYLPDGSLEHLGRLDDQVKIRGSRVEPAGVEAVLRAHPSVHRVVVAGRRSRSGDNRLVAWVVPRPGGDVDAAELRDHAASRLAPHEVPSAFVVMLDLPLTPSGKVDYRQLPDPAPASDRTRQAGNHTPSALEEAIIVLWRDILGVAEVGLDDSFLNLGGDSLAVLRLLARLPSIAGRSPTFREFFADPTVAGLARRLAEPAGPGPARLRSPTIRPRRRGEPPAGLRFSAGPIDEAIVRATLPHADAAAISYLPDWLSPPEGPAPPPPVGRFGLEAFVSRIITGALGRLAVVTLPLSASDLYRLDADLPAWLEIGVSLATRCGARTISFAGLIPSACGYGAEFRPLSRYGKGATLTTGHAATASAVVATLQRALTETGRTLASEDVGIVGLGSVGSSTLRLMLKVMPHPHSITVCDVPARRGHLDRLRSGLAEECGYRGPIRACLYRRGLPDEIYHASLLIGATNAPDVVDVDRLRPGLILVDDSGPHCFPVGAARRRMARTRDLLCVEGGALAVPGTLEQVSYVPPSLRARLDAASLLAFTRFASSRLTACVLASLLTAAHGGPPTLGTPRTDECVAWWELLIRLGVSAAPLHLEGRGISRAFLAAFAAQHGPRSAPMKERHGHP